MPKPVRGLFVGLTTLDIIHLVRRNPEPNEKLTSIDNLSSAGGPATNASVAFSYVRGNADLLTRIPASKLSGAITDDLENCSVNVLNASEGIPGDPDNASIIITEETGDRAVISSGQKFRSENHTGFVLPVLNHDVVVVDGYHSDLALPLCMEAKRHGKPVILDTGTFKTSIPEFLDATNVAVVSEVFSPPEFDGGDNNHYRIAGYLHDRGIRFVAVTRGHKPVFYSIDGLSGYIEVPQVKAVDTLGAGDFYHGALAWFLGSAGLRKDSFTEGLEFAAHVASKTVQSFGTRSWMGKRVERNRDIA